MAMKQLVVSILRVCVLSLMFWSSSLYTGVTNMGSLGEPENQVGFPEIGSDLHFSSSDDNSWLWWKPGPCDIRHLHIDIEKSKTWNNFNNCTVTDLSANCAGLSLTNVPQNLPSNILQLDLHLNKLKVLHNFTFARYSMLMYLNLSFNRIEKLKPQAFYNLSRLKKLDMHCNGQFLHYYPMTRFHVFCPLINLTYLDLGYNKVDVTAPDLRYPDKALSCMENLESLAIDGLRMDRKRSKFGEGFKTLTKLTSLVMRGYAGWYCALGGLYTHSFQNLRNLESLTLINCGIEGNLIYGNPFSHLRKLQKLDLSRNQNISFNKWQRIFDDLSHLKNLTQLYIDSVINPYTLGVCLDKWTIQRFPPHLTVLDASNNNLEFVNEDFLDVLPPSLRTLYLNNNRITFGAYLRYLSKLTNLTHLYVNGRSTDKRLPNHFPYKKGPLRPPNPNCSIFADRQYQTNIELPPNLHTIELNNAGLKYTLSELKFDENNPLITLSASGNHFRSLKGPITGLDHLRFLNISSCGIQDMSLTFLHNFPSLEVLRLDSNGLGTCLSRDDKENVFSALVNLKILNLTDNGISSMPSGIFKNLTNLTSIYLRKIL